MSLTALPVTVTDLTNLQAGMQTFTDAAAAAAQAAAINAGTPGATVYSYSLALQAANNIATTAAMVTDALVLGGVPTAGPLQPAGVPQTINELQNLATNYGRSNMRLISASTRSFMRGRRLPPASRRATGRSRGPIS